MIIIRNNSRILILVHLFRHSQVHHLANAKAMRMIIITSFAQRRQRSGHLMASRQQMWRRNVCQFKEIDLINCLITVKGFLLLLLLCLLLEFLSFHLLKMKQLENSNLRRINNSTKAIQIVIATAKQELIVLTNTLIFRGRQRKDPQRYMIYDNF